MKVYLSPSCQTWNPYAYGNTNESAQCNRIAEYAREALIKNGYEVKKAVANIPYSQAITESNAWKADLHIPIHTNAGGGKGTEVFAWSGSASNKYVKAVYAEVSSVVPTAGRGIKTSPVWDEVAMTNAVCVYIECEFHDNATTAKWIVDNSKVLGEAIARGICNADGKVYKSLDVPPATPTAPTPIPATPIKPLYRVRTSWAATTSQIGAFASLENARQAAAAANPYKVFNDQGKIV